ncbi:AlpA family phage regulatory protein [Methylomonas sp. HYX-M1]|uniref:AlpA family phage regulatory protein n=1 Tax=Methylomonas sp. HYX-M1 TaxID=3139307 RepID=UPI00345BAB73
MTDTKQIDLLDLNEVLKWLKISRAGFYKHIADGTFPQPIKIGTRSLWSATDLKQSINKLNPNNTMETQQPVSRNEAIRAQNTIRSLAPAVASLEALPATAMTPEVKTTLTQLKADLQAAQSIVNQAAQQLESKDVAIINAAVTLFFKIDNEIHEAKTLQANLASSYTSKIEELTKKQFSPEEIAKIVADPAPEIAALEAKIKALHAEKAKCNSYLADSPRFDEELLAGTRAFEVRDLQKFMKTMVIG